MLYFVLSTELADFFSWNTILSGKKKNNKPLLFLPKYLAAIFSNINKVSMNLQGKELIIFVDLIKLEFSS